MRTHAERYQHTPVLSALLCIVLAALHLAFEHLNGGVQSHHLLNNADLPAISNWWGMVLLPVLGWLLGSRIRAHLTASDQAAAGNRIWLALAASLSYGLALAVSFNLGAQTITSSLFIGLFLLGIVLPIYRVEYIVGFVISMTFTFGAILPSLVATLLATLSAIVHFVFRFAAVVIRKQRNQPPVV